MTEGTQYTIVILLWNPELQRTPKTHPVTTPRLNLAFVKLGNFDEITTYYDTCEKPWKVSEKAVKSPWKYGSSCLPQSPVIWVNCSLLVKPVLCDNGLSKPILWKHWEMMFLTVGKPWLVISQYKWFKPDRTEPLILFFRNIFSSSANA